MQVSGTPRWHLLALGVLVLVGLSACTSGTQAPPATSTSAPTTSVTTTTVPTTTIASMATTVPTTSAATSTVPMTTTTTAPTTTTTAAPTTTAADPAPGTVSGFSVSMGGGSGEVIVEWERGTDSDLDRYNVWYSLSEGAPKALLGTVSHDPGALASPAYDAGAGRTAYVDYPRAQAENTECYQISAIDAAGHEGGRTAEQCLPGFPPGAVTDFTVGIGGGSGEVFLTWSRGPEPDLDRYNLWYSELPGQPKAPLASVVHAPGSIASPAYDAGGGMTAYIDFPRDLANGKQCYQISPVDVNGNEGPLTVESCLSGL